MLVCGIDPGIGRLGYALLQSQGPNQFDNIDFGCLQTSSKLSVPQRLDKLYDGIMKVLAARPDAVAIETLFFNKNVKTAVTVAEARGVALLCCAQCNIPVSEYSPPQVKLAIAGYGRAEKRQIQLILQQMLRLDKIPTPDDAADALAIAVCHSQVARFDQRIQHTQR